MAKVFPHLDDTKFPDAGNIDVYKYRNDFDYTRYDYSQMEILVCNVPWDVGEARVGNRTISGIGNVVYFETKEKRDELTGLSDKVKTVAQFRYGLNYDEYLMIMIASLSDNVRLLRIMDLVQINMKYRYYADFNMMEYYTGVRFTIEANSKSHEFEDAYK